MGTRPSSPSHPCSSTVLFPLPPRSSAPSAVNIFVFPLPIKNQQSTTINRQSSISSHPSSSALLCALCASAVDIFVFPLPIKNQQSSISSQPSSSALLCALCASAVNIFVFPLPIKNQQPSIVNLFSLFKNCLRLAVCNFVLHASPDPDMRRNRCHSLTASFAPLRENFSSSSQ